MATDPDDAARTPLADYLRADAKAAHDAAQIAERWELHRRVSAHREAERAVVDAAKELREVVKADRSTKHIRRKRKRLYRAVDALVTLEASNVEAYSNASGGSQMPSADRCKPRKSREREAEDAG
jgi:reverse gyrase